jgi:hypothetical protein
MSRAHDLVLALSKTQPLADIARQIGYSRTAVSLFANGKYDKDTTRLEKAILDRFDQRHCPHLKTEVTPSLCLRKALTPKPFGGTQRLLHWQACQACPHKPTQKE